MADLPSSSERMVTLRLPHGQMCSLLGALNWARKALRNMPAGLQVPLDTLDELDIVYQAFTPAFDAAALGREPVDEMVGQFRHALMAYDYAPEADKPTYRAELIAKVREVVAFSTNHVQGDDR